MRAKGLLVHNSGDYK